LKIKVTLGEIAYARSGDKGSSSNVGIIFINSQIFDWAVKNLTCDVVGNYFSKIALGGVERYLMENLNAINFILKDSLDGGGSESLLNDAQGKTHAQGLLKMKVTIPKEIISNEV
tara:strand:- start:319 stop:663 length:345 start_codon:yes stop_codon:yes gene_type:complete